MLTKQQLDAVINEKHAKTGSLDAAVTKSNWVAYKEGFKDGQDVIRHLEEWRANIMTLPEYADGDQLAINMALALQMRISSLTEVTP